MRVVLVGWADGDWRLYRQSRWIGRVRERPEASAWPRWHFEIDEEEFRACLGRWDASGARNDREAALDLLRQCGASEVTPP